MIRAGFVIILAAALAGCACNGPAARSESEAAMFAPVSMRIHPIFSTIKDFDGDGRPDGIEALLEFQDQFGDPTKACGTVVFELFGERKYYPDPRADRLCNPWVGSLRTLADQQARWNRTSRTYLFQLSYPTIKEDRDYVLSATFDTGTRRFFDRIVFEGIPKNKGPASKPSTEPSTEPTTDQSPPDDASTQPADAPATAPSGPSPSPSPAAPAAPTTQPAVLPSATQGAAGVTTHP